MPTTSATQPEVTFSSKARVTAAGVYAPPQIVTNHDLERVLETSDEWIVRRTGIRQRRASAAGQYTSDLCHEAVRDLAAASGKSLADVDHIIVATATPDYHFPSVAAILQHRLGVQSAGAIDISAACAGFAHGLIYANALITSGTCRKVLVVGGEVLSKAVEPADRSTSVLFGDGAGAVLLEHGEPGSFIAVDCDTQGEYGGSLYRTSLKSEVPGVSDVRTGVIRQEGRSVYKWATSVIPAAIERLLAKARMTVADIDWFVPHSANMRIIEAIASKLDAPLDKFLSSVEMFGNTSSASIPLALIPAMRDGRVHPGDRVLLIGFGGGLVWSAAILTV